MSSSFYRRPRNGGGGGDNPEERGGQNPEGQQSQQPAQLEFNQAMTDFKVMFPAMDTDVIEAVLRSNNGAVDATIDHLLAMSTDLESSGDGGSKKTSSPTDRSHAPNAASLWSPPSYQQATKNEEEEPDLIEWGAAGGEDETDTAANKGSSSGGKVTDPMDLLSEFDTLGRDSGESKEDVKKAAGEQKSSNSSSTLPNNPPPTSMIQSHAYSHPRRQELDAERAERSERDREQRHHHQQQQQSLIPTQQMLQDRYEENLRAAGGGATSGGAEASAFVDPTVQAQVLEDERLALMLQNEEFLAELRGDQDFMSTLAEENAYNSRTADVRGYGVSPPSGLGPYPGAPGYGASSGPSPRSRSQMDEAAFREKLKSMGKSSKRKFTQLAAMFSRRRSANSLTGSGGTNAKQMLGHAPAPSKDNLLLNDEPLIAEDDYDSRSTDDDERGGRGGGASGGGGGSSSRKTPTKGKYTSFS